MYCLLDNILLILAAHDINDILVEISKKLLAAMSLNLGSNIL